MATRHDAYGPVIAMRPGAGEPAVTLERVKFAARGDTEGSIDEETLRDLLFEHPQALPIAQIDTSYDGLLPVCRELSTPAGFVDALYVNRLGNLTLAEFKLWRNPQARREVIGQILDYAKDLASWDYEDLQREVSRALKRPGNVLWELVANADSTVGEAAFVDNVTRHLRRGEFLMLIVGDGIREGAANIVEFVQRHSGLQFNLALVEAAIWRDGADRLIVQPRVLARTEIVRRHVAGPTSVAASQGEADDDPLSTQEEENLRFWSAVLGGFSFSDATVEAPKPRHDSRIDVLDAGAKGLWFSAYLQRRDAEMGCYLARYNNTPPAQRMFDEIEGSIGEMRCEFGDDLTSWRNPKGNPRIGFRHGARFLKGGDDFDSAVEWMRERLDRLVSTLRPRLRKMSQDLS
ncbi:MAG: DUF4268 domain-containing protein [Alphaproteobacteria bacterium]|nr:DUF4268 domain-containing protein [Alphaproteobacteria bacterium]